MPGDVNPLHYKGYPKGHYFAKGRGKLSLPQTEARERRARASTAESSPTSAVAKALAGQATAKREVGTVVVTGIFFQGHGPALTPIESDD